uniref:Deoxyribodipyrimidine photo-lyase n=1 Tax=Opuntia streptacantha TaxID=393608 RepID=A0A7C9EHF9_OPUST
MSSSLPGTTTVQPGRIRIIKEASNPAQKEGPVVYWMFRDQRVKDNWALIHAVDQANKMNVPVAVAFNLFDRFKGAGARQLGFMLRGLKQLQSALQISLQIPFFLFQGEAVETIPTFLQQCEASLLVTDFTPLREIRKCKEDICKRASDSVSIHEVDAHNVVPVWEASSKLEYSAKTLRGKINKLLPSYLIDFPTLHPPTKRWDSLPPPIDWERLIEDNMKKGEEVPELDWCEPGESAAMEILKGGKDGFLTKRIKVYATDRNNPLKPRALSGLSPYLHFGQISAQRCAFEARNVRKVCPQEGAAGEGTNC